MASPGLSQTPVTVIRAARLLDGRGGPPIEPGAVVIQGKQIAAIGHPKEVEALPEACVIDVGDRTLLPGLIDAHVHLKGWRTGDSNDILITPHPLAAPCAAADC